MPHLSGCRSYTAFATLLSKYQEIKQQQLSGIQQPVYMAPTVSYGKNVFIGAFAYLRKCSSGK